MGRVWLSLLPRTPLSQRLPRTPPMPRRLRSRSSSPSWPEVSVPLAPRSPPARLPLVPALGSRPWSLPLGLVLALALGASPAPSVPVVGGALPWLGAPPRRAVGATARRGAAAGVEVALRRRGRSAECAEVVPRRPQAGKRRDFVPRRRRLLRRVCRWLHMRFGLVQSQPNCILDRREMSMQATASATRRRTPTASGAGTPGEWRRTAWDGSRRGDGGGDGGSRAGSRRGGEGLRGRAAGPTGARGQAARTYVDAASPPPWIEWRVGVARRWRRRRSNR